MPLFWLWVTPGLADTLFLLAMGVIATVANWVGVKPLRLGEASVIGNIQYIQLVYAAIPGVFYLTMFLISAPSSVQPLSSDHQSIYLLKKTKQD